VKKVTAFLLLLIGLLQYKLWYGEGNVRELRHLNDRIAELRQEGAMRRERNAALEAEVMDLKQGLDAVEERARHELGMIMVGEEFVQVIDPQHEPEPSASPSPEKPAVKDESPDAAKNSKKEKTHQKQKNHLADTPKPAVSKPPAKKTVSETTGKPSNQQTASKKTHSKPKAAPKPIKAKPLTPEPAPDKSPDEVEQ